MGRNGVALRPFLSFWDGQCGVLGFGQAGSGLGQGSGRQVMSRLAASGSGLYVEDFDGKGGRVEMALRFILSHPFGPGGVVLLGCSQAGSGLCQGPIRSSRRVSVRGVRRQGLHWQVHDDYRRSVRRAGRV